MNGNSITGEADNSAPWMRNPAWAAGQIPDQGVDNLLILWISGISWTVASLYIVTPMARDAIHRHDPAMLLPVIFPIIGLGMLASAARRTFRIAKYHGSILNLPVVPASPGGNLAGSIHVPHQITRNGPVTLNLMCVNRTLGSGRRGGRRQRVLWQESQKIRNLPPCPDGTDIPVFFQIPPDAQTCDNSNFSGEIIWRLEARCRASGVSYFSQFAVPVFTLAPGQRAIAPALPIPLTARHIDAPDPRRKLNERGITCQPIAGNGMRITLAAARRKPIVLTFAGLAFIGVGVALISLPKGLMRVVTSHFAIPPLLIGLLLEYAALYIWLISGEVTARRGSIVVERKALVFHWRKTLAANDIADIIADIDGTSSSSVGNSGRGTTKTFYGIKAKMRTGRPTWIANHIFQKDNADWLANEIKFIVLGGKI